MKKEIVSVVACGPSALKCGAQQSPGTRITVNDAFWYVASDRTLSMDGRWARYRWPLFRALAAPHLHLRRSAYGHVRKACNGEPPYEFTRHCSVFDCDINSTLFGDDETQLNGRNSGYCALNLAFVLKPRVVYLFGFDMNESTHFFGEYDWHENGRKEGCTNSRAKFSEWVKDFSSAAEQFRAAGIRVINTNPQSAIRDFEFGSI